MCVIIMISALTINVSASDKTYAYSLNEYSIVDLDKSVVPNVPQAWVCAGAFESNVKIKSIWLAE